MNSLRKIILFCLIALISYSFAITAINSLYMYETEYYYEGLQNSPSSLQVVDNVYVIVVDGLRYDYVKNKKMKFINTIVESKAAFFKMKVKQPSYSRVAYQVIATGARPEIHGYLHNLKAERSILPNIFGLAKENNLPTGAAAFYWFSELYNNVPYNHSNDERTRDSMGDIKYGYFYNRSHFSDHDLFMEAKKIIKEHNPNLMLIHPMGTDLAGHKGGGKSSKYLEAVKKVDDYIKNTLDYIDLDSSLVIITGDHGHRNPGGHGGDEREVLEVPFIALGKNVKPGVYNNNIYSVDIAPTVAFFLGLPFTPYMEGNAIIEMIEVNDQIKNEKLKLHSKARYDFLQAYSQGKEQYDKNIKYSKKEIESVIMNIRAERIKSEKIVRGLLVTIVLILMITLSCVYRKALVVNTFELLLSLCYFMTFYLLFYIYKYDYSFSAIYGINSVIPDIAAMTVSSFSIVLALFFIGFKKKRNQTPLNPFRFLYWVVIMRIVMVLFLYFQVGLAIKNTTPNFRYFTAYFMSLYEVFVISIILIILNFLEFLGMVLLKKRHILNKKQL